MPITTFAEQYSLFDITPIENLFIDEYMLRAPGNFVKAYIYGLRQCYHGEQDMNLARMALALDMDEDELRNAFTYWERQGVLCRINDNPPCYQYFNLKQRLISDKTGDDGLYRYKDFNLRLQSLFGSERLLQSGDLSTVYDWIEVYNLSQDVALLLVEYLIGKRGKKFRFGSCSKVAQEWAERGIRTPEDAREYMRTVSPSYTDMKKVLKRLNINAEPTIDQQALYDKWSEWGFTLNAILECCKETAKARNASPGYLDGILSSMHSRGLHSVEEITSSIDADRQTVAARKDVLRALGQPSIASSEAYVATYSKWLQMGFTDDAILLAATNTVQRGAADIDGLNSVLVALDRGGLHSTAGISAYFEEVDMLNDMARALLERSGESRKPTPADRTLIKRWCGEMAMPFELLEFAADKARGVQGHRFAYIDGILKRWQAAGIRTVDAAKAESDSFVTPTKQSAPGTSGVPGAQLTGKALPAGFYEQRHYDKDELEKAVITDIMADDADL